MPPNDPAGTGQAALGLRKLCRTILDPCRPEAMALQLERVVVRLSGEGSVDAVSEPDHVRRLFKKRRRLPDPLVLACAARADGLPPQTGCLEPGQAHAICFAAAAYPQTAAGETELVERLDAFLPVYASLPEGIPTSTSARDTVFTALRSLNRLDGALSDTALGQFLLDLSGGEQLRRDESNADRDARCCGAALYLATCTRQTISTLLLERWRTEGPFLGYMRRCLHEPPSFIARQDMDSDRWPSWEAVLARLRAIYTDEKEEHHSAGVILERMTWRTVREWFRQAEPALVGQIVLDFWQEHYLKLRSGFPEYAFRSRLVWWWKQCLLNHLRAIVKSSALDVEVDPGALERLQRLQQLMRERRQARERQRQGVPPPTAPGATQKDTPLTLTPDELRHYREIYRVVRTNFYPERKRERSLTPQQRAADNETYRRLIVDAIWFHRLEHQIIEDGLPVRAVKKIQEEAMRLGQIDLSENGIASVCRRLKLRVMACDLSRRERLSNMEIRNWQEPKSKKKPFFDEAVILTPASLTRIVPPDHTPLWALTVHLFLYPLIEVAHPDPWDFRRYVRELWHWVTEPWFDGAVTQGRREGNRSDAAVSPPALPEPFPALLTELRALRSPDEVDAYLSTRPLQREEDVALKALDTLIGSGWRSVCSPQSLDELKELCPNAHYWIVPVWFLALVERLPDEQLLRRLKVDESDTQIVLRLADAIRRQARNDQPVRQDVARSTPQRRVNP